tara:strand:+ start:29 stop:211 length:183 start_codon:yes stop_codon:yes gene_type:complete
MNYTDQYKILDDLQKYLEANREAEKLLFSVIQLLQKQMDEQDRYCNQQSDIEKEIENAKQ